MNTPLTCSECGEEFRPKRSTALFCRNTCRDNFHRLMRARGDLLAILHVAAAETRGRYRDSTDKELAAYARAQADALVSAWTVEDRLCGRNCAAVVRAKMAESWRAVDALASRSALGQAAA